MEMNRKLTSSKAGFTIIEVVAVLLIMGVISAVAISRMPDLNDFDLTSEVELVKSHLRFAQLKAINTDTAWGIYFNPTSYYLFQGVGSTSLTPVPIPGEPSVVVDLIAKKSNLRITPPSGNRVIFDSFGSPGGNIVLVPTNGENITIKANTGFIP